MPKLYFTVTTDLTYDQRMIRICSTLAEAGYDVTLVGRRLKSSKPLSEKKYRQQRLKCFYNKGKLFYAEYNIRLFFFLLFRRFDLICAIDLDTILPCYYVSRLRNKKRVYDAHELFCEMKEVVTRPKVYKIWKRIEKNMVPHFTLGYTVNHPIAKAFKEMYGAQYEMIRNIARFNNEGVTVSKKDYILYQGAVNEGRSFETLIPAMAQVDATLIICGDGNFMEQAKKLVADHHLEEKVIFKGMLTPAALLNYTNEAYIGLTLFENNGLSNYYSLANRFFDYMQAGVPQLCVGYPVYQSINEEHEVALLVPDTEVQTIADALNKLIADQQLWQRLHGNCMEAAKELNWENEGHKLVAFYKKLF